MTDEETMQAASWALIIALKTANSALHELIKNHLQHRNKQRAGALYKYIRNWLNPINNTSLSRKQLEDYDDYMEDHSAAAFETIMIACASVPNSQIDWFINEVEKLAYLAQNKDKNEKQTEVRQKETT